MSSFSPTARRTSVTTLAALAIAAVIGSAPAHAAEPSYTVVSGDTLSAIADRHGVALSSVFAANGLNGSSIIYPGDRILLGGKQTAQNPAPAPAAPAGESASTYTVVSGDTLSAIASRHGVSLSGIFTANGLNGSSIIYPGDRILLGGQQTAQNPASAPAAPKAPTAAPASTYTVVPGDTLSAIASRHGVSLSGIFTANGLNGSSIIHPGQVIKTSGPAAPVATPTPAPAPETTPVEEDVFIPGPDLNHLTGGHLNTAQVKQLVADTAASMGVDTALALAVAEQESTFNQNAVSYAGAVGIMQVMPTSGVWASELVGRQLNLHSAADNVTAGVAILYALQRSSTNLDEAIASYYQGQYSVQTIGMYDDTIAYVDSVKSRMAKFQ